MVVSLSEWFCQPVTEKNWTILNTFEMPLVKQCHKPFMSRLFRVAFESIMCTRQCATVMEHKIVLWILFLTMIVLLSADCPNRCTCYMSRMECRTVMPDFIPPNVRSVVVYGVTFENTVNFSDPGWTNVTYLSINPDASVFETSIEKYVTLQPQEFRKLQSLEHLQIACRCLREVEENAFSGLDKLKVLDLSNNILTPESFVNGFKGKDILPSLEELYLANTSVNFGMIIGQDLLDAMRNKTLKVLDISQTNVFLPKRNMDLFAVFPYLEKLNLSRSIIAMAAFLTLCFSFSLLFPDFQT